MNKHFMKCLLRLSLLMLLSNSVAGQKNQGNMGLIVDKDIKVGRLKNGFTYYLKQVDVPHVEIHFVVKAGYNQEMENQKQYAHLIEHMAFGKTANFNNARIYFQQRGIGPNHFNASTGNASTHYFSTIPFERLDLVWDAIRFYRDCAQNIDFSKQNINVSKASVLAELGWVDPAVNENRINTLLMGDTRYKKQAEISLTACVGKPQYSELRSYYDAWYRSDFQAIILVGNLNVDDVERRISALFSDLKPSEGKASNIETTSVSAFNWSNEVFSVRDKGVNDAAIEIYIKRPHHIVKTDCDIKNFLIKSLISELLEERFRAYKHEMTYRYLIDAPFYSENISRLGPRFDAFVTVVHTDRNSEIAAIREILIEHERLRRYGFSIEELKVGKTRLLESESPSLLLGANSIAQQMEDNFVYGAAILSADYEPAMRRLIENISCDELNELFREWLAINNNLTVIFRNLKSEVGDSLTLSTVLHLMEEVRFSEVPKYVAMSSSRLEEDNPSVELLNIEELSNLQKKRFETSFKEIRNVKAGVSTLVLENGVRVIIKDTPTAKSNGKILLDCLVSRRDFEETDVDFFLSSYAAFAVSQSGLGGLSKTQMDAVNKKHGVDFLVPYCNVITGGCGFSGQCDFKGFETVLQLIYLYSVAPQGDSLVMSNLIHKIRTDVIGKVDSPSEILFDSMRRVESGATYSFRPSLDQIANLDAGIFLESYKRHFTDVDGPTFIFAGNFVANDSLVQLIAKYLGNIPRVLNKPGRTMSTTTKIKARNESVDVVIPFGEEISSEVYLSVIGRYEHSVKNKVILDLINDYLSVELVNRLRYKELGPNSVGVALSTNRDIESFFFRINFQCLYPDVGRLVEAVKDEIDALKREQIDQGLLSNLKDARTRQIKLDSMSARFWLSYILNELQFGQSFDEFLMEAEIVESITNEDVQKFWIQYVKDNAMNRYVLKPRL